MGLALLFKSLSGPKSGLNAAEMWSEWVVLKKADCSIFFFPHRISSWEKCRGVLCALWESEKVSESDGERVLGEKHPLSHTQAEKSRYIRQCACFSLYCQRIPVSSKDKQERRGREVFCYHLITVLYFCYWLFLSRVLTDLQGQSEYNRQITFLCPFTKDAAASPCGHGHPPGCRFRHSEGEGESSGLCRVNRYMNLALSYACYMEEPLSSLSLLIKACAFWIHY